MDETVQRTAMAYAAAWNRGDAASIAQLFDTHARHVTPLGSVVRGRVAIGFAHRLLLEGLFRGTKIALVESSVGVSTHGLVIYRANWQLDTDDAHSGLIVRSGELAFALFFSSHAWLIADGYSRMTY